MKKFLLPAGFLFLGVLIFIVATESFTFTDSKYRGFWDDARAYLLQEEPHPTLDQLRKRYGKEVVERYLVDPRLTVAYLPSEEAAFTNLVGYVKRSKENR